MPDRLGSSGLRRFTEAAARCVDDGTVPGLVALVARGKQVHVATPGSVAYGGAPVQRDSVFRASSTSKPVTAAVALALVEEGLLELDAPVERWLPELAGRRVLRRPDGPLEDTVPAHRPATVRDLLTFTAGFGLTMEMFDGPEPWPVVAAADRLRLGLVGPPRPHELPGPDEWVAALGSLPLMAQPGERWLYNTGSQVSGVLVSRAAGAPFSQVLRSRVLGPLGMRDTAFWAADRLVTAYEDTGAGPVVWDAPDGDWARPPAFEDGAGGLVSTADDLLAFARMLLRGGEPVLRASSVEGLTRDQLTPAQRASAGVFLDGRTWGLGGSVVLAGPARGAFGWEGGLGTSWLVDRARDLTVIVLTQRLFRGPGDYAVHAALQEAAYSAVG
ncbi:serine hydrolase domain-containing protein [Motilibacter aurantiacus]|uniref:serine hydrolase domain-containing protein n=1 Tax=Motilibacter aurantiacus TaxID=2714955 RepID=UPI00140DDC42|nr:serine hydrolase domain-containing protein [Motilibacter aurantiacus]NHC44497.1 beta-lactamase family protein [Motilibacter aurantiacus]